MIYFYNYITTTLDPPRSHSLHNNIPFIIGAKPIIDFHQVILIITVTKQYIPGFIIIIAIQDTLEFILLTIIANPNIVLLCIHPIVANLVIQLVDILGLFHECLRILFIHHHSPFNLQAFHQNHYSSLLFLF